MEADERYMSLALDLAARGMGSTSPNPMVGAVVVKEGEVIATGFHEKAGGPHAEVIALDGAGEEARGSTLYVTLEPCSHTGLTPPCTDRIIASGVRRVVVAMGDPNPRVNGKGIAKLGQAGIDVQVGVLRSKAAKLNEVFVTYMTSQRPFVSLKAAMTLDGKIATRTGQSRWISSECSRAYGHRLRDQNDAIMVGIGTLLADDPRLTTRLPKGGRNPLRIVVDSMARTPIEATVVRQQPDNTLIFATHAAPSENVANLRHHGVEVVQLPSLPHGRVPLKAVLSELGQREITSLLVEGGSVLNYSLLDSGLVDKVFFFIAPIVFGGAEAPTPVGGPGVGSVAQAWHVTDIEVGRCDTDVLVIGYIKYMNSEEGGVSCSPGS